MAHTDGSTTKAKGKKGPKAKKGNGHSITVSLQPPDGGEPEVAEAVTPEAYAALKKQMEEILTKFGPVLKAAEEQQKQGAPAVEAVVVKPKKPKAVTAAQAQATALVEKAQQIVEQALPVAMAAEKAATPVAGPDDPINFLALPTTAEIVAKAVGQPVVPSLPVATVLPDGPTMFINPALAYQPPTITDKPAESVVCADPPEVPTPLPPTKPKKTKTYKAATKAVVTTQYSKGKPEDAEETIEVRTFVTQPAVVGLEFGLTINLGNYESARVTIRLDVPCYAEEKDAAFSAAAAWIEDRIKTQRDAIVAAKGTPGF